MIAKKKLLSVNELQEGMVLACDIVSEGKVLLTDGVIITESILDKLKHMYFIYKVEIYVENTDSVETINFKEKTVKEIENGLKEFSSNLESIFSTMSKSNEIEIKEIREFSKRIQAEFNSIGSVIRNIIFFGSGDDFIYRHSINVTAISYILGKWIGLSEKELNLLTYAAVLHDFGKTKLDKFKMNLKNYKYEDSKEHPVIAYNLIKKIPYLDPSVGYAVLMHHERMDGTGYPLHIKSEKISKYAKIISIADIFDEVSSNRYSEDIKGPLDALKVIQDLSLNKLDSMYSNIFLSHIINYYMGENVLLNDKRSCKVIQIQLNDLTKPLLIDENGFLDLSKEKDLYVEKLDIEK